MADFTSVIQSFPPTLWEQYGLEKHTLMLLQVSKGMVKAVCHVGRAALPAQIDVKPSEVREVLCWNHAVCLLYPNPVKLTVNFVPETGTAGYLMTAHNVIMALRYMRNVETLDFSALQVIGANEHVVDTNTGDITVYWSRQYTPPDAYVIFGNDTFLQGDEIPFRVADMFLCKLTRHCTGLKTLRLTAAMLPVVTCEWDDLEYWGWLEALSNLRTLSLVDMKMNREIAHDVLTVAMQSTSLTELIMDNNPIDNMYEMLSSDTTNFRLPRLVLSGCGFGGWDDTDGHMQIMSGHGVFMLLTAYTCLSDLDLSCNNYSDTQGDRIAEALRAITSLTKLDLRDNHISEEGREQIRAAWAHRKPENLLLDEDTPDDEDAVSEDEVSEDDDLD